MTSAKVAIVGVPKIKIILNQAYDVITFVHDITNKILLPDSNYIVDVVTGTKFCNSSISITEFIATSFYKDLTTKKTTFLRVVLSSTSIIWG